MRRRTGWGFSLVELLVAIGAFAIVTVSVATIFSSVGDTISTGRRQSRLNNLSAQIERVMRDDFERMTRDGFLVIRHEHAVRDHNDKTDADNDGFWDGVDVSLFSGDDSPRPRRVDSIMFFTRGQYETARGSVQPGFVASGSEAAIWYGHGQRKPESADGAGGGNWYSEPRLDDAMQGEYLGGGLPDAGDRLGYDPGPGLINPNEFAADWTLLRHVTVLSPVNAPNAGNIPDFGSDGLFGIAVDRSDPTQRPIVADNPFQVALQPAVSSIFWSAQELDDTIGPGFPGHVAALNNPPFGVAPVLFDNSYDLYQETDPSNSSVTEIEGARRSSGLVDVATTSIDEIMSVVNNAGFSIFETTSTVVDRAAFETELASPQGGGAVYPQTIGNDKQMRAWMLDALPTAPIAGPFGEFTTFGFGTDERTSARVRYEPTPPELFTTASVGTTPQQRLQNFYDEIDKEVLSRWAFVPRCTEFIVEWSYGWTYGPTSEIPENASTPWNVPTTDPRYRQLVWFGHDRRTTDWDGDGVIDENDEPTVTFYERRLHPTQARGGPPRELLSGRPPASPNANEMIAETYAFGHFWNSPTADGSFGVSVPGFPPGDVNPTVSNNLLPWPWPKLIRITMTIADPGDPSIESTIEVVLEVPGENGAS